MVFIKGDTHADIDLHDLGSKKFPEGRSLTKDDYVIILGDFGMGFMDEYHLKWLRDKKFTTLFLRGNHDSTEVLYNLPEIDMFGSKVRKMYDSVYCLLDGEVYTIDGSRYFIMGGALSIDRETRKLNIDWWEDEQPSYTHYLNGCGSLEKHGWQVDYILTHTCPTSIIEEIYKVHKMQSLLSNEPKYKDPSCKMLDFFQEKVIFLKWYFGHFHVDESLLGGKYICSYHKVHKVGG